MNKVASVVIGFVFWLALVSTSVNAESSHPEEASSLEHGSLLVSTFHTTGIPNSTREIELSWPAGSRRGPSGLPLGQLTGTERSMGFEIFVESTEVWLNLNAADKYPLSSRVGLLGGQKDGGELLRDPNGFTYHSSKGFLEKPSHLKGWRHIYYEPAWAAGSRNDLWIRQDGLDKVAAILRCKRTEFAKFPKCELHIKDEPLFMRAFFDRLDLDKLDKIEAATREFTSNLLSGDWSG